MATKVYQQETGGQNSSECPKWGSQLTVKHVLWVISKRKRGKVNISSTDIQREKWKKILNQSWKCRCTSARSFFWDIRSSSQRMTLSWNLRMAADFQRFLKPNTPVKLSSCSHSTWTSIVCQKFISSKKPKRFAIQFYFVSRAIKTFHWRYINTSFCFKFEDVSDELYLSCQQNAKKKKIKIQKITIKRN
jgi:hypothetical protein